MKIMRRRAVAIIAAAVVLILQACGGGGDGGGGDPTGPDNAGSNAVGSIVVSAGNGQSVGPGEVVPARPVLKVLSDRSRPLQGAQVAFSIENGRGTLDAASVTTDANGEAVMPRWGAPLVSGEFAVTATATGAGGSSQNTRVTATVTDAQVQSISQSVPTGGGTVSIPASVPPLGGLQITVPPASFPGTTQFSITYGTAPPLPNHLTLASPLIGISAGSTVSDSIIFIDIPSTGTRGTGQTIRAFVLTSNDLLVPLPTFTTTANSIRVGITDFRPQPGYNDGIQMRFGSGASPAVPVSKSVNSNFGIRILIAFWTVPTTGVFDSGFEMLKDNMSFANYGSYSEPFGYCGGSTVLSGGWYLRSPPGREQFPPLMTTAELGGWFLDNQMNPAIRLASELQKTYGWAENTISGWKFDRLVQNDRSVWENILYQLDHGARPVYIAIYTADKTSGHAILAYKADAGTGHVSISDPNFPENLTREMVWNEAIQRWAIFQSAPNAGAAGKSYVLFADASYLFRESNAHIQGVINAYNANHLVATYPHAAGESTLKDGTVVSISGETSTFNVESRDNPLKVKFTDIVAGTVHVKNITNGAHSGNGVAITNATTVSIPLKSGPNKIAVVVWKTNGTKTAWYDAKVLNVTRALPKIEFFIVPLDANVNATLNQVEIGLVDEDFLSVAEARTLTVTLIGGPAGAVLTGGGSVTTNAADGKAILNGLSVNKAGEGYQLQVSSPGLATVTSSTFKIAAVGGTLSGRTIHGATGNGLDGVTIAVSNGTDNYGTTSTASGDWTIDGVPDGTYDITASKNGYVSTTLNGQVVAAPSTVSEPIPLVPNGTPAGVFGNIRNATNQQLITSLTTVEARSGMNNTTGSVAASIATSTGQYILQNLPAGVYTLQATNPNFTTTVRTGVVVGGGGAAQGPDLVMSPAGSVARIVLTWGSVPNDLDSHLTGPTSGTRFWVYYGSRGSCSGISPFVCLDVDDTNGNGPETMTFTQITPGVYRYYVYDYSNRNNNSSTVLGASGAKVEFYVGNNPVRTFFVPGGTGNAWAVFTWDGTTVTTLNQLYTISGVPQPARIVGPLAAILEELYRIRGAPPKMPD